MIDTYRTLIDEVVREEKLKIFLATLIAESSIHANTSGVFKGFYKNKHTGIGCFGGAKADVLIRIYGKVELKEPIFRDFKSEARIF